jgi:hypothetical protein
MSIKLKSLKPAQNYLILKSDEMDVKIIFKLTLIDLIMSKVIRINEIDEQFESGGVLKRIKYCELCRGEKFENYTPADFEMPFLEIFHTFSHASISLNQFIPIVARRIKKPKVFIRSMVHQNPIRNIFEQNIFQRMFGRYSLSEFGEKYKIKLVKEVDRINDQVFTSYNIKDKRLIMELMTFHGNILLLNQEPEALIVQNDVKSNDVNEEFRSVGVIHNLMDYHLPQLFEVFEDLEVGLSQLTELSWSDLSSDFSGGGDGGDGGDGGGDGGGD